MLQAKKQILRLLPALVLSASPAVALAQGGAGLQSQQSLATQTSELTLGASYIPVRGVAGGDTGARLSESTVLHLGVGAEAGYDSNVFYQSTNETSSPVLRVIPYVQITNAGRGGAIPAGVYYDLSASLLYREFLSDDPNVKTQRAFNPAVYGLAEIGPGQRLSLQVSDFFLRAEDPPYGVTSEPITRDYNLASLAARFSPGGGRFQGMVRYSNALEYFETSYLKYANNMGHDVTADLAWRWLPVTAVYLQLSQGYIHYLEDTKQNALPFRALVGLRGLVTEKIAANLGLGYSNGFYRGNVKNPTGTENLAALVEFTYSPTLLSRIILGYRHEFRNSPVIGNFFEVDSAYLSLRQSIATRFLVGAFGRYEYRRYDQFVVNGTPLDRKDNVISAGASADYFVQQWFYAGFSYVLAFNDSNVPQAAASASGFDYTKHLVLGRVGVTY